MYSNKQNINIVTSLLRQRGVCNAVVCAGSRNAPVVHNLHEAGLRLHPVTDERSAAFYALGLAIGLGKPVVVCVTSGSAVLNLLPGIAEAAYRHVPVIAVTADRPAERIGQLDGQTLPQPGALRPYVAASVDIPEPHDTDTHVMCNRLVNEALIAATSFPGAPVQINLRIDEPLMGADIPRLPRERLITEVCPALAYPATAAEAIFRRMAAARRPMAVVGQSPRSSALSDALMLLGDSIPTLYESLASDRGGVPFEGVLADHAAMPALQPDFVLYAGETLVSKRLKRYIASLPYCECWAVSADGNVHDTFKKQTGVIHGDASMILPLVAAKAAELTPDKEYRDAWRRLLSKQTAEPDTDEARVVALFESMLPRTADTDLYVHYANSTAVRLANLYARHYVYANRGVNGIEGSVSTAAGHSLSTCAPVYCVTGDLSFFYDGNALWNPDLSGNLRILLLNNGHGGIFDTLPGMPDMGIERRAIMGCHSADAKGLCASCNVAYDSVDDLTQLPAKLEWLLTAPSARPLLLETKLFTIYDLQFTMIAD